ncbi:hypothetical protein [Nitratireductor sp. ZSWI3]|uniref:hypothetical protein n=1 Tax=Nitratireductor sp. ZSWI3 TaxID=2966359 RepID=UPI0035B321F2
MKRLAVLAILVSFAPASAFANACPAHMAEIDQAMASASLSEEDMAKVRELRALGEEQHNAGDHAASMATLGEAKALLGL